MEKRKPWIGGYIRESAGGRPMFMIERWVAGRKVHRGTGCSTKEGALKELARFEMDPLCYRAGEGSRGTGVVLDAELILAYRDHQLAQGLTRDWVDEVARCLADWCEALGAKDLRALRLHVDIKPALAKWPGRRPHRIKAIKGLYRWLREERGGIDRSQDPTLDLKLPKVVAEKLKRRKVVPPEDVEAVLRKLPHETRDVLHLLTATAWHVSEARRFAESGEMVDAPPNRDGYKKVLRTKHKGGSITKTGLAHPEHIACAERILERKSIPNRVTLARHMKTACKAAEVTWFGMGQMRHSVITWGVRDGGATVQTASTFAGHKSTATTDKYYLDMDIPTAGISVYRLAEDL